MEQLIFIGIILFFSMLEAVARKRREAGQEPLPPVEDPEARSPRLPQRELPTYDQDPSFDDGAETGTPGRTVSSEGLIPADVWEEIQALARGGKVPTATIPKPAPRPPPRPARSTRPAPPAMSTKPRVTRAPPPAEVDAIDAPEHPVHQTHPAFGTPVHDRLTGFAEGGRGRRSLSEDGAAVRTVLRKRGAGLRQAVLLHEILGPPVSLKDDPSAG